MADPAPEAPVARALTSPPDTVRAAFRDLHANRLHGFALLLTLGDRPHAAALAGEALADATDHLDELRHPERAAAWLRRHVVRDAGRLGRSPGASRDDHPVLRELGADPPVIAALRVLATRERAALIAGAIERLDRRDVATVVDRDGSALDRLLRRARARYVDAYAAAAPPEPGTGPIVTYIFETARSAMA